MYFTRPSNIEDRIVKELLIRGSVSTVILLNVIKEWRTITKQGYYAALRRLKEEDIVVIYKKKVSLNTTWLRDTRQLFDKVEGSYKDNKSSFEVLSLEEKESINYTFSTIKNLDNFWGHLQNILTYITPTSEAIYAFDPHYWFYIGRSDIEKKLLKELSATKRQFLMNVGGNDPLDMIIKKDFNNDYLQYSHRAVFKKDNYYITVIGPYITEAYLDAKSAKHIEEIYKTYSAIELDVLIKLEDVTKEKGKNRLKISKDTKRAEKFRKMLGKDFYILTKKQ